MNFVAGTRKTHGQRKNSPVKTKLGAHCSVKQWPIKATSLVRSSEKQKPHTDVRPGLITSIHSAQLHQDWC
jgi:hypothetical protein